VRVDPRFDPNAEVHISHFKKTAKSFTSMTDKIGGAPTHMWPREVFQHLVRSSSSQFYRGYSLIYLKSKLTKLC
jgi:hypothetical protein